MEQLNRIELIGHIGNIRKQSVGDTIFTRISVATNYAYKSKDGQIVVETTWHNVLYWNDTELEKGNAVKIIGRLRQIRYINIDGIEISSYEILAKSVEKISEKLDLEMSN